MPMEASAQPGRSGISRGCAGFSVKERISPSLLVSMTPKAEASATGTGMAAIHSSSNTIQHNEIKGNAADGIILRFGANNNTLMHNDIGPNGGSGIAVGIGSLGNTLKHNDASGDAVFDMSDGNASCGTNSWTKNSFVTANQVCIQ